MERPSNKGVLNQLNALEQQARNRRAAAQQPDRVTQLKTEVQSLTLQREQLRAEIQTHKKLQKLISLDKPSDGDEEEEEEEDEEAEQWPLLQLMVKHSQLRDRLFAHHLLGGYDIIKTHHGKGVCVSVATAYEGVLLDTYHLEMELRPALRIGRHSVPAFVPVGALAERSGLQTHLTAFLDTLSRHLNAYAGRKQQLQLAKELRSVEVMESNAPCSRLVLMLTLPKSRTAVLCTLEYCDPCSCLPTNVCFHSEDEDLPSSAEWTSHSLRLMETPLHTALSYMKDWIIIL